MEQFELVKIDRLVESPWNPRKIFDEKKLKELTASVKEKGIIEPMIVRPQNGKLEIVSGHRRFRAGKEAKLVEVPVIVRAYTDKEVVEIQLIETLQKEDVHALDEADGYRRMIEELNYDVPGIALKISKSESYVYQRLQLSRLVQEGKKALMENKITPGHAILISRLQPKNQKEAIKYCLEYQADDGARSIRELVRWIDSHVHLDLNKAVFDTTDKELVKGAGNCIECPKRTGFMPALFSDIKQKDICTDPECFNLKKDRFIEKKIQESEAKAKKGEESGKEDEKKEPALKMLRLSEEYDNYGSKKPSNPPLYSREYHILSKDEKPCEFARQGIMVDGRETGKIKTVCAEQTCKRHWSRGRGREVISPVEKERRKKEIEKKKKEKEYRDRVINAILGKVGEKFKKSEMTFVCKEFYGRVYIDYQKILCAKHGVEPKKDRFSKDYDGPFEKYINGLNEIELNKLLVEMVIVPEMLSGSEDELIRAALVFGVDWKKLKGEEKKPEKDKKSRLESSVKKEKEKKGSRKQSGPKETRKKK